MTLKVAGRIDRVAPFIAMEVLQAANQREAAGEHVLHLEVGQPATPPPRRVLDSAQAGLFGGAIGYTNAAGMTELRERIAKHYQEVYGEEVRSENVVVTTGSSGGFLLAFLAAFELGDRIGLAEPGYPAYRNILTAIGMEPVSITVGPNTRFQPTPDLLKAAGHLDGLIVASPSNPAGTMIEAGELDRLCAFCSEREIRLVSDEIYHGITFGETAATALGFTDDAIIVNSFSKYYSMTGWRLGWLVVPEPLVRPVEKLAQNLFISAPALSQIAGITALGCRSELDLMVARYAANRTVLRDALINAGVDRLAPSDGAFYVYADIGDFTDDSEEFASRMLREIGVAATPGVDFDQERGGRFMRFSYAGDESDISQAATKLADWLPRQL